ncbi:hypothetical protein [Cystobacter fuscus]|nr:hypothetical protein [Cystobacter fuscus]
MGRAMQNDAERWELFEAPLRVLSYLAAPGGVRVILEHRKLSSGPAQLSPA